MGVTKMEMTIKTMKKEAKSAREFRRYVNALLTEARRLSYRPFTLSRRSLGTTLFVRLTRDMGMLVDRERREYTIIYRHVHTARASKVGALEFTIDGAVNGPTAAWDDVRNA
jgi:hypothetical protein